MLEKRPDGDPALLNALGYTLADHSLEPPHAETLIKRALTVMPDSPRRARQPRLGALPQRWDVKGATRDAAARLLARTRRGGDRRPLGRARRG